MGKFNRFGAVTEVAVSLAIGIAGCNKQSDNPAQTQDQQNPNIDPASANMAQVDGSAPPANESATGHYQAQASAAQPISSRPAATATAPAPQQAGDSGEVPPPPPDDAS